MADTVHDDSDDVKLTHEGWYEAAEREQCNEDYGEYLDQLKREDRDLRDWARYTLETGDYGCGCRDGWRCFRCRVQAIVCPEPVVREFEIGEVPF